MRCGEGRKGGGRRTVMLGRLWRLFLVAFQSYLAKSNAIIEVQRWVLSYFFPPKSLCFLLVLLMKYQHPMGLVVDDVGFVLPSISLLLFRLVASGFIQAVQSAQ